MGSIEIETVFCCGIPMVAHGRDKVVCQECYKTWDRVDNEMWLCVGRWCDGCGYVHGKLKVGCGWYLSTYENKYCKDCWDIQKKKLWNNMKKETIEYNEFLEKCVKRMNEIEEIIEGGWK